MKFLKKVWEEVKQGENLDLYLTVLIAIILAILNTFGLVLPSVINSFSLAVLALLTVGMLGNRHRLEKLLSDSQTTVDNVLKKEYTDLTQTEIAKGMERAVDLLLIGTDLSRTLQRHYHLLEKRLKAGQQVRVLLVDPAGDACEILANRRYNPITPEHYRASVFSSIQALCNLKNSTAGSLDLRVINYPISRGGIFIDMDMAKGKMYVWHHNYKTKQDTRPKFELQKSDGYWFEFLTEECNALWADATEWQEQTS